MAKCPNINNMVFEENFNKAETLHGHKCPSLFYGVKLSLMALAISAENETPISNVLLEGSSKCIKDGLFAVLKDKASNIRVSMNSGNCSLTFGNSNKNTKITLSKNVRDRVNQIKESHHEVEVFQTEGLAYVTNIPDNDLFSVSEMNQSEFNSFFEHQG